MRWSGRPDAVVNCGRRSLADDVASQRCRASTSGSRSSSAVIVLLDRRARVASRPFLEHGIAAQELPCDGPALDLRRAVGDAQRPGDTVTLLELQLAADPH